MRRCLVIVPLLWGLTFCACEQKPDRPQSTSSNPPAKTPAASSTQQPPPPAIQQPATPTPAPAAATTQPVAPPPEGGQRVILGEKDVEFPETPPQPGAGSVDMEVGCGKCVYKLPGVTECRVVAHLGDEYYFVEGITTDASKWGLCERPRIAGIVGDIFENKILARSMALPRE